MKKFKYFILGFSFLILGCKEPKLEPKDFIGVWKADDSATIIINADGTCILNNLNNTIINSSQNEISKINTRGTWKKVNDIDSGITGGISTGIKFTYKLDNKRGGTLFYISGKGINENKAPWDLFVWKGDPDEMIKYKFVKQ